jgi:ornithine cyclodeaminase/alanine dehydrogenase-like protein (mu-crystallin family)
MASSSRQNCGDRSCRSSFSPARAYSAGCRANRAIGEFQHTPDGADLIAIGEVLAGRRHLGRDSDQEITILDSSGLSIQDL